jgi:hypothetical protein
MAKLFLKARAIDFKYTINEWHFYGYRHEICKLEQKNLFLWHLSGEHLHAARGCDSVRLFFYGTMLLGRNFRIRSAEDAV